MSEADVNAIEDFVGSCRSSHPCYTPASSAEDRYKAGMDVPTSVLNGCNDPFVAADEKREKASIQFFVDMGLMALLCRHNHPL
jgi:hypothetical protein